MLAVRMTNVEGEHFKLDKVKPMLQNELFNIECLNKEEQTKKIITSKCTTKATHTQLSLLFFKEDHVSNELLGFSKTRWSINKCNTY